MLVIHIVAVPVALSSIASNIYQSSWFIQHVYPATYRCMKVTKDLLSKIIDATILLWGLKFVKIKLKK